MKIEKYDHRMIRNIAIGFGIVVFFTWVLFRFRYFQANVDYFISIISPFLAGIGIAFILNIPLSIFEKKVFKRWNPKLNSMKRGISLVLSIILVSLFLAFIGTLVIPKLKESIISLYEKLPLLFNRLMKYPILAKHLTTIYSKYEAINMEMVFEKIRLLLLKNGSGIFKNLFTGVSTIFSMLFNGVIAFTFSIYLIVSKEKLIRQVKDLVYITFSRSRAEKILFVGRLMYRKFYLFFKGQFLEAIILGMMCFVGMLIFRFPNAATISIIVACGAIVPIVGTIIAAVFATLFVFIESPGKALLFLIFILVVQQIEGNVTYPRVVGNSIGLPSVWVLVAITVGGSLFGVLGMLVAVPIFSGVYDILHLYKEYKLNGKIIDLHVDKT